MAPTLQTTSPVDLALIGVGFIVIWIGGTVFYRLFLDPLRSVPGPLLWRLSALPRVYHHLKGELPFVIEEMHKKYGPVVRISPHELVFNDVQAWKDIYGHRTGNVPEVGKWHDFYVTNEDSAESLLTVERKTHGTIRRQLSHGFSDKSMREQETLISVYIQLLVQRLRENCNGGATPLNMRDWYNWTTFDVIGDLGFGKSFGCLEGSGYHPWVRLISESFMEMAIFQSLVHLGLRPLVKYAYRWNLLDRNKLNLDLVKNTLKERMESGKERPDLIDGLLKKRDELKMSFEELVSNSNLLIIAGSETTASTLCGVTYYLAKEPAKLAKVVEEVRTTFKSEEEITLTSVNGLSYMLACLNEALRRYPPASNEFPRQVPKGGATILGRFVPEGTTVSIYQWAMNNNPSYWKNPTKYAPERWLGDPEYKDDQRDAMQPFSVGPRNCIGRNLAYAEMRLILAKILYNFDMSLCEESYNWAVNQKAYGVWAKPALYLRLTPAAVKSA